METKLEISTVCNLHDKLSGIVFLLIIYLNAYKMKR